jgi:hypothetical protein
MLMHTGATVETNTDTRIPREDLVRAAVEVLGVSDAVGAVIRALGGVAVALRCPSARPPGALTRDYSDLDFVGRRSDAKGITGAFVEAGFEPAERFNAIQAGTRMRFERGELIHADVFLEEFRMCHSLRLSHRLTIDDRTIPLADLLLTKLQVAKLSGKDLSDIGALLLDYHLTTDESGINASYITELLASDWGWWRTATDTLARIPDLARALPISPTDSETIASRATGLNDVIAEAPKGLRWRARARVGDRRPWREDPEEVSE